MFEWLICFVAGLAFTVRESPQIHGMTKGSDLNVLRRRLGRVINHCVTDVAVASNDLACIADMLAIVTAETA